MTWYIKKSPEPGCWLIKSDETDSISMSTPHGKQHAEDWCDAMNKRDGTDREPSITGDQESV